MGKSLFSLKGHVFLWSRSVLQPERGCNCHYIRAYTCHCCCLFAKLCLFDPMDCSLPGSSVCGIFQARILVWVVISFSRKSSQPRYQTCISCIGMRILHHGASKEAPGHAFSFCQKVLLFPYHLKLLTFKSNSFLEKAQKVLGPHFEWTVPSVKPVALPSSRDPAVVN